MFAALEALASSTLSKGAQLSGMNMPPVEMAEGSALAKARRLAASLPDRRNASMSGGEFEDHEFWISNAQLFTDARLEYGMLHPSLYDLEANAAEFIHPELTAAVEACEEAARSGRPVPEDLLKRLLRPAGAPGVWRLPMFTEHFCSLLLDELNHIERSGIPLRRPNGMNRFGAILDELGLSPSLDHLTRRYLRPLGQMLYPWLIAAGDADEHYGFVVRYKRGEDLALAEHADASVLTLNANLGYRGFTGGALTFRGTRGVDAKPQEVPTSVVDFADFAPGEAILHLGGQYHAALPIEEGERVNLVVWLHAKHEVVRFAPYDEADRLPAARRWGAYRWERSDAARILSRIASGSDQREKVEVMATEEEARRDRAAYDEL